jgi:hypothetical protein
MQQVVEAVGVRGVAGSVLEARVQEKGQSGQRDIQLTQALTIGFDEVPLVCIAEVTDFNLGQQLMVNVCQVNPVPARADDAKQMAASHASNLRGHLYYKVEVAT